MGEISRGRCFPSAVGCMKFQLTHYTDRKAVTDRELDEAAEADWLCIHCSQSNRNDGVYARSGSVLLLFNVYGLGIR